MTDAIIPNPSAKKSFQSHLRSIISFTTPSITVPTKAVR